MERLPSAGELIPTILRELSAAPGGSAELLSKVAEMHGFDPGMADEPDGDDITFRLKYDAALGFLIRSGFVGREKRRVPLHITRSGRSFIARFETVDMERVYEAIEPRPRNSSKTLLSASGKDTAALAATDSIQDASRVILERLSSQLPGMPLRNLHVLWVNAEARIQDPRPEMKLAAALVVEAVAAERDRRAAISRSGEVSTRESFRWPNTDALPGKGPMRIATDADEGILVRAGYRVGRIRGEREDTRRSLLDSMFARDLPDADEPYRSRWGGNASSDRLKKMAETIAALARNGRRRQDCSMEVAVGEWEDDLAYLHARYYEGRFDGRFEWPAQVCGSPEEEQTPRM